MYIYIFIKLSSVGLLIDQIISFMWSTFCVIIIFNCINKRYFQSFIPHKYSKKIFEG